MPKLFELVWLVKTVCYTLSSDVSVSVIWAGISTLCWNCLLLMFLRPGRKVAVGSLSREAF